MADYLAASPVESQRIVIQRMIDDVHVALPCAVLAFSGEGTPKVKVQIATQLKITLGNEVTYRSFPVVENVPVALPYAQTAGLALTLPIKAGDTGLLIVPDRGISNFVQSNGEPTPPPFVGDPTTANPRAHSITDGIFIPGVSVNAATLNAYNETSIELRDKERKCYISLGPDGIVFTDGTCVMEMKNGNWDVRTPGTTTISSTNIELGRSNNSFLHNLHSTTGTFIDKDNVVLNTHSHEGVEKGSDTTGEPVK